MKDEYIIINKTAIQKRIEELENTDEYFSQGSFGEHKFLKQIISQSTPLIPEIEKIKTSLFQKLRYWREDIHSEDELYDLLDEELHNHLSNLKLDIK